MNGLLSVCLRAVHGSEAVPDSRSCQTPGVPRQSRGITFLFIDAQYPQARERLAQLENERATTANEFQKRYDEAATRWDEKISTFKNETTDLLAAYKAETRRLMEDFSSSHNLDTRKNEQEARRKAYSDLQGEQLRVNSSLQYKQLELEVTRQQLAGASQ